MTRIKQLLREGNKVLVDDLWSKCLAALENEMPAQQLATWLAPLQAQIKGRSLQLFAPNRFVLQWVTDKYAARLHQLIQEISAGKVLDICFAVSTKKDAKKLIATDNPLFVYLDGRQKIILTSYRYFQGIAIKKWLKSHFRHGLAVAIEPPELELHAAALMRKAEITVETVQCRVAEYYKIKVTDLHSKRRNRYIARPRQMAMALTKALTNHSLLAIGDAFGGRDHTTVLYACRKIKSLQDESTAIREDWKNLFRLLTR